MLEYIKSRYLSSSSSINIFDFFILYTTIPHSKLKDRLRELVQLCFIKKNGQRRYKYLVLGRDRSWFVKKKTKQSDSTKKFSENESPTCSRFWLTTYMYLLCLVDSWHIYRLQTVLLFSPTCSFIRMRQISYRGFSRKTKRSYPDPLISRSAI
jgi:hypothetical protein